SHRGAFTNLRGRTTAEGMIKNETGVVGKTHKAGDVPRRDLKRFGAKNHRPFSRLLEGDAVMQTAR
ncbi:MAG: hypothetical protein OXG44_19000, partial [Gammaproteobacteria bacterium]|nr:hypothetical protein [Gammaproteobacteria bacterium]